MLLELSDILDGLPGIILLKFCYSISTLFGNELD